MYFSKLNIDQRRIISLQEQKIHQQVIRVLSYTKKSLSFHGLEFLHHDSLINNN